jgi:hypothetical protein
VPQVAALRPPIKLDRARASTHFRPPEAEHARSYGTAASAAGKSCYETVAIVRFDRVHAHYFGPPNDEALDGHPLRERGLLPYSQCEVQKSTWIANFEKVNRVHPYHKASLLDGYRHFIFVFHDSVSTRNLQDVLACCVFAASQNDVLSGATRGGRAKCTSFLSRSPRSLLRKAEHTRSHGTAVSAACKFC